MKINLLFIFTLLLGSLAHAESSKHYRIDMSNDNSLSNRQSFIAGQPITLSWKPLDRTQVTIRFSGDDGNSWYTLARNIENSGEFQTFIPNVPGNQGTWMVTNSNGSKMHLISNMRIQAKNLQTVSLLKEAEEASFRNWIKTATDGQAFGNKYIHGYYVNRRGWADFEFFVPEDGVYLLWGRILGMNHVTNSFFFQLDNESKVIWDIHKHDQWEWDWLSERGDSGRANDIAEQDPLLLTLSKGRHVIHIGNREKFTRLDRIILTNDLNTHMTGEPSQWIDLLTPTRGTHILPGSNYEIKWNSGNISGSVNLDLSFDGGETFNYSIAQGTPNDGSFVWNVPNDMKEGKVVMRVSDISGSPYDVNWNFFSIKDPEDRSYGIVITNPNGGEELVAGSKYTIFWKSFGFDGPVHVYVSSNNGRNWETIAYNRPATGLYVYTVHNIPSDQYKIRVAAAYDDYPVDTSDATFKVIPSGSTPSVESVTLYNPVGGEHWKVNSVHKIGWESYNFDGTLTLDFSTDNGLTWETLTYDREPRGMLTWPVPDKVSDQCLMKLYDPTDNIPMAITRQPFAIVSDKNEPQASDDDFAMHFDGENDFVEIASHPSLNVAEQFTIEFWLKTNDPYQSWTRILEKGSWDEYYIGFYGTHGKIHGALRTDVGNSETSMTIPIGPSNNAISPNSWYHIAATFDGAKAKLFINGVEQPEKNVTVSPRDLTRDLIIGAVKRAASSWGYIYESNFKGTLDELRIWNIPRSSVQILDNMYQSIEPDETGLVACYSFNEGSGQTLHDHSPYANHGRLGLTPNEDDSDPIWVPSDRPLSNKSLEKPVATETKSIVDEYALLQNYPNPFNSETTIAYTVPSTISQSKTVKLEIYDLTGRRIKTLVDGIVQSGYHVVRWDGRTQSNEYAASGIYFYKLVVGDFKQIKRLVLIK